MRRSGGAARWARLGAAAAALACAGCGTTGGGYSPSRSAASVYVNPAAEPVRKIAVLPFKAQTELIGASVSDLFVTELLKAGRYEIVERNQLSSVLGETELALSGVSANRAAQIGQMVGADGVVVGTVDEYAKSARRGKTYAVVGVAARMVDCRSGRIVWSADLAGEAASADISLPQHARKTVHDIVSALYRQWR
jgi:curli biogenesis system outer membrane secretion channel CsgG